MPASALRASRRAGRRARPASPACRRRPGDARHRRRRRPRRAAPARRLPSPPPSPPRPRRAAASSSGGTPSSASLTSFAYATTPPRKTSLEPGTDGQPRRDEPARARLRRRERPAPRAAERRARSPPPAARRRANRYCAERLGERPARAPRPRASAPGSTRRSTWISKSRAQIVASTPSPVAAGVGERLRDRRLARAVEAQHAASGRPCARRARARTRLGLERARPQPLQLRRRPGQDDRRRASPASRTRPGAVPARPSEIAPSGSVACLRTPGCEVGVRPAAAARRPRARRARSPRRAPRRATSSRPAACASELDRAVVVRRPEPAGDEAQVGLRAPPRSAASSSSGRSPTIVIRAGSRPSDERLRGEERAVQVGALAADELAAGDDDRGPRAARRAMLPARPAGGRCRRR